MVVCGMWSGGRKNGGWVSGDLVHGMGRLCWFGIDSRQVLFVYCIVSDRAMLRK